MGTTVATMCVTVAVVTCRHRRPSNWRRSLTEGRTAVSLTAAGSGVKAENPTRL